MRMASADATPDPLLVLLVVLLVVLGLLEIILAVLRRQRIRTSADVQPASIEADPVFLRHLDDVEWPPGVSVYDMSEGGGVARRVPLNQVQTIDNEHFVGRIVWMARPTHSKRLEKADYKYKQHFGKKTRTWEFRVQGRFKSRPPGKVQGGVVMKEYDYSLPLHGPTRKALYLLVPLLERAVKQRMHLSWGARGEAAKQDDAELLCLVAGLQGLDQIIVSAEGCEPAIDSNLDDLGIRRDAAVMRQREASAVGCDGGRRTVRRCVIGRVKG